MHYERATGKITVLLDNIWFANGVALSPNEDFLVVSDLVKSKITQYWLSPGKFGETKVFAEGLPGTPDNITPDKNGFWVAFPVSADPQNPFILHSLAQLPLLRKFIARLASLVQLFVDFTNTIYPNEFSKNAAQSILRPTLSPPRSTILRFGWDGKIIAAYHSFDGAVYTHVMELNGQLYLGSISHNYIAKVVKRAHL
jgi:adipocyte plasma membrane-associated protein